MRIWLSLALLSMFTLGAHAQSFKKTDLPEFAPQAQALDINNSGLICGYDSNTSNRSCWIYDPDSWAEGIGGFNAAAINSNGVIAGSAYAYVPNYAMCAQTYYDGQWRVLDAVAAVSVSSDATDINDLGSVVGYCSANNANSAFLLKNGVVSTLADLDGNSYAEGINIMTRSLGITGQRRTGLLTARFSGMARISRGCRCCRAELEAERGR